MVAPHRSGERKPIKAKVGLGFLPRRLGFPWLFAREKAKESQQKPRKAKPRAARAAAARTSAVCAALAPPVFTNVYVC